MKGICTIFSMAILLASISHAACRSVPRKKCGCHAHHKPPKRPAPSTEGRSGTVPTTAQSRTPPATEPSADLPSSSPSADPMAGPRETEPSAERTTGSHAALDSTSIAAPTRTPGEHTTAQANADSTLAPCEGTSTEPSVDSKPASCQDPTSVRIVCNCEIVSNPPTSTSPTAIKPKLITSEITIKNPGATAAPSEDPTSRLCPTLATQPSADPMQASSVDLTTAPYEHVSHEPSEDGTTEPIPDITAMPSEDHAHDSSEEHTHDSSEDHTHDSSEDHEHDSSEDHEHDSSEDHEHDSSEDHEHDSSEDHITEPSEDGASEADEVRPTESMADLSPAPSVVPTTMSNEDASSDQNDPFTEESSAASTLAASTFPPATETTTPAHFTGKECTNRSAKHGDLLPYPGDCTRVIQCAQSKAFVLDCPSGLHFNKVLKVCDWPENAGCQT